VFNPQSGSYWFYTSPRLKLIPELTVVLPLSLYRFQGSSPASQVSLEPLSRERLIIISHHLSFVNTFFEKNFDFFDLFFENQKTGKFMYFPVECCPFLT